MVQSLDYILRSSVFNLIMMSGFISWMIGCFASHSWERMKMLLLWSLACIGTNTGEDLGIGGDTGQTAHWEKKLMELKMSGTTLEAIVDQISADMCAPRRELCS